MATVDSRRYRPALVQAARAWAPLVAKNFAVGVKENVMIRNRNKWPQVASAFAIGLGAGAAVGLGAGLGVLLGVFLGVMVPL